MKSTLITMSAITGKPTKTKIQNYMTDLKKNGIDRVMLYPRSGCELEYLTDEWFEKIGEFIDTANNLDMNIWLYDEFNWPSGDAGGLVTQNEEFRLKAITVKGKNTGKIGYYSAHNSLLFGEKFFPDLLSEKAVDYFIETTHEKYYQRFGAYFGNVIEGFYTDEPSIGYCRTENSIPYYYGIEDDYNKYCGRDFAEDMRNSYEFFCKNAVAVLSDRFNKCFITKIRDWCAKRNVLMTGHLMADDTPFGATRYNGDFLKNLSSFSLPGIDEISTDLSMTAFTKGFQFSLFGGAEYASGKYGAMAELFALGPCDMPYSVKRCMIFLTACFKINHYFLAVSHMDMRGNMKIIDYFNDFCADQPDFGGTSVLSEDAKIAAQCAQKDFTPDVYIQYPSEICANHITDTLNEEAFTNIINALSARQIQWKFVSKNDDCGNIPTIKFSDKMEYILNGTVTGDMEMIIDTLEQELIVTDDKGGVPYGLFVRKFDDNTTIILNLYGEAGTYKMNGRDIYLDKHGVFISTLPAVSYNKKEKIPAVFSLNYCNDNMIRAMYINSQTVSEIRTEAETEVCFAVRKGVSAYISGKKIEYTGADGELPDGLKDIYNVSAPVKLNRGINILKSADDYKYLPSVFVIGDFGVQVKSGEICGIVLSKRKQTYTCGEYFNDFGKIEYRTNVTVPDNARAVEIKGTNLYTCLYADKKIMGERICSPYIFNIDESLRGKNVDLTITQYSSIGPIFGDVDYFDKKSEKTRWKGTPKLSGAKFGFTEFNWVF